MTSLTIWPPSDTIWIAIGASVSAFLLWVAVVAIRRNRQWDEIRLQAAFWQAETEKLAAIIEMARVTDDFDLQERAIYAMQVVRRRIQREVINPATALNKKNPFQW